MTPDLRGPQRHSVDLFASFGLIALVLYLTYQLFSPLFSALLWGTLLAIICAHPYERLVSRLKGRRHRADVVFAIVLLMVLLLPATFFAFELTLNFPRISSHLEGLVTGAVPSLPEWIAQLPGIGEAIRQGWAEAWAYIRTSLPQLIAHAGGVATWLLAQVGTFGAFLFEFALGMVLALFMLHHRFVLRSYLHRLLQRIGGAFAVGLVSSAFDTTRTAFTGAIVASVVQTLLAGLGLFVAGVPALILFCGFTFLLALVQIGAAAVLVVAEIILISKGSYLAGLGLALWFIVVVMSADNIIRPYFASKGSDVPGILSFLGSVGGFLSWGLIGVFVGPVLTSILYQMLRTWINAEEPGASSVSDPPAPPGYPL